MRAAATIGRRIYERLRLLLFGLRTRIVTWFVFLLALAMAGSWLLQWRILSVEYVNQDLREEYEELARLVGGRDELTGKCWIPPDHQTSECPTGRDPQTGRAFGNDVGRIFDVFLEERFPPENEAVFAWVEGRLHDWRGPRAKELLEDARWVSLVSGTRESEPARDWRTPTGTDVRFLAVPLTEDSLENGDPLGVFVVARFPDEVTQDLLWLMALAGLGVLLVSSVAAGAFAGRILMPLRRLTDAAQRITETDLSHRIQVERTGDEVAALTHEFNKALSRIEEGFNTLRRFENDVGHELRTPITIIRGHLELLGPDDDPNELRETVALVEDELDRMARMVEDLLALARLEHPDFLELETVDVGALTQELYTKVCALAPREWLLDGVATGRIIADRERLTQAVVQLAQNATQHTEEGSVIGVGSALSNGHVRLWVRDTGPGIAEEDQKRIFERFVQARAGPRPPDSTGLGLSIVKAIAKAHHGDVVLESCPGDGATFTILVPVDEPEPRERRRWWRREQDPDR